MRYYRNLNNALTMTGRGGAMTRQSLFGFGGFGLTDPVLDQAPDAGEVAADTGLTDGGVDPADVAADAEPAVLSTISFYPDGTWFTTTPGGNTRATEWTDALAAAAGVNKLADPGSFIAAVQAKASSVSTWKWAAMLGIPVVGLATWYATKRWG